MVIRCDSQTLYREGVAADRSRAIRSLVIGWIDR
jgi:hypothetical protein